MKKELDKELYPDYVYPEYTPDLNEPFREPIAKLGKKITDRIPQKLGLKKITKTDPEYWGLAGVLTDEEAELALKLDVRKPKTGNLLSADLLASPLYIRGEAATLTR